MQVRRSMEEKVKRIVDAKQARKLRICEFVSLISALYVFNIVNDFHITAMLISERIKTIKSGNSTC
jgi:hypothetical protein